MRSRKFLEKKRGIKRNPVDLAEASHQPTELRFRDLRRELNCQCSLWKGA
jgi:hypothetical protein